MHFVRQLCAPFEGGGPDRVLHERRWLGCCLIVIVVGGAAYGATMGLMTGGKQVVYAAIKFPLVLLLTNGANVLINGMLAQVMGVPIRFGQSARCLITAYALMTLILAAWIPVILFIFYHLPGYDPAVSVQADGVDQMWEAVRGNSVWKLSHVPLIAAAGILAHLQLYRLLTRMAPVNRARKLLAAWLAINLFLGAQISFILRPYFVSPGHVVEFIRPTAFQGNFYETMGHAARDVALGKGRWTEKRPRPKSEPFSGNRID